MRRWIVTLSERPGPSTDKISLSRGDIKEIISIAADIRQRVEAHGMFVDWALQEDLRERFESTGATSPAMEFDASVTSDIVVLYRKLIGVLAFMVLRFGETGPDGEVVFAPASEALWEL
jgi:hypothetical protein